MRFSCGDFTFPLLAHDHATTLISMLGVEMVDIGFMQGRSHIQPSAVADAPGEHGVRLRQALDKKGLRAADLFLQSGTDLILAALNHPDADRRRQSRLDFACAVEFAVGLASPHITVLPGMAFAGESGEVSWDRAVEELAYRVELARKHGLCVGVECHRGSLADTPQKAATLLECVPGLTLTLDYSHFIRSGFAQEEIAPLLAHASHFHARGASAQRMQTPVRESAIDFAQVVADMRRYGYDGAVTLEYVWEEWEENFRVDTLSETILLKRLMEAAIKGGGNDDC